MPAALIAATTALTIRSFLLPLARYLRASGWVVHAAARDIDQCDACSKVFHCTSQIDWHRNPLDPRNVLIAGPQFRRLLRRSNYNVVHLHTPVAGFVGRLIAEQRRVLSRTRVIYTAHGFHFQGNTLKEQIFRTLERTAAPRCDRLVVINRADERAARAFGTIAPEHVVHVPGVGIDLTHYSPAAVPDEEVQSVRNEFGLTPDGILFTMIAEFNREKRHTDAVRALAKVNRKDVHLAFAGAGPAMPQVAHVARAAGIDERVHFLGYRDDVRPVILASAATILPSQREGLPRSVMESLAIEVPVLGANVRGTNELVDSSCGTLFPVGDVDQLARGLQWFIDNPDPARRMGAAGRTAMQKYSLESVLPAYLALYEELANGVHA